MFNFWIPKVNLALVMVDLKYPACRLQSYDFILYSQHMDGLINYYSLISRGNEIKIAGLGGYQVEKQTNIKRKTTFYFIVSFF